LNCKVLDKIYTSMGARKGSRNAPFLLLSGVELNPDPTIAIEMKIMR
jgi:hypothetical protein